MKIFYGIVTLSIVVLVAFYFSLRPKPRPITISANSWPGYTPLFYAQEKGWLKPFSLQLYAVSSLNESILLYESGLSDGLATTNDAALRLQKRFALTPIFFFDRSDGADKILANHSLESLQTSNDPIDVYLEIESVNALLLNSFIEYYRFAPERFRLHNISQELILDLPYRQTPTLLVTYDPYVSLLKAQGYQQIASSALPNVTILDLLLIKTDIAETRPQLISELRRALFRAAEALERDPKTFYTVVQHYLEGLSYEEFMHSLEEIKMVSTPEESERFIQHYRQQKGIQP